ncbi:MAG: 7-cyano-7-deazaguanine synthase in queuosine biosynthesis [Halieaceae bacterium]|jgi:7-cyano-7-deazaguanine synthase in queuosine biosynthesis
MSDKSEKPRSDTALAALQGVLQKIARLSPEETRQVTSYLAQGTVNDSAAGNRLRNAAIRVSNARTLVMLSGGLDSVGMLYLLLKQEHGHPLHVHHVNLYGWESDGKPVAESLAIRDVTDYLWAQGYRFEYSESTVHYEYSAFDQSIYYFQAASLAASMPLVSRVAIGRLNEDIPDTQKSPFRVHPTTAGIAVFNTVLEQWPLQERHVEVVYPVEKFSKAALAAALPQDLKDLACSCRSPVIVDDNSWARCGKCTKCRAVKPKP